MKRKAIIFVIATATFLFAFGGSASLLATALNPTEMGSRVQIQQDHIEKTPMAIAGNSWGGVAAPPDDTQKDPPKDDDEGDEEEGNSWGG